MASLEKRNGIFRVVFRFSGQKFSRSLKTRDEKSANLSLARVEDNLRRLELGTFHIPAGSDISSALLSSGTVNRRPTAAKRLLLGDFLDRFLASIPESSIEENTHEMLKTHIRHLKRLIGVRTPIAGISIVELQAYINDRSKEKGQRGRNVSAVTIGKEVATLRTAWKWAKESKFVDTDLPSPSRLRFPKLDEKPPFKTWQEIERIVDRASLSEREARDHWDCVYLDPREIAELLADVECRNVPRFVAPMFAVAAYTGARRSEILRSQVEDIDLEAGHMVLREKKRVRGQRSTRSVPISAKLHKSLASWLELHPGGKFTFSLNGKPISRDQAHDYFSRTVAGSKWQVLRGWHVLRHSFISNCASSGVDQRMIDDWVGHQTDEMRRRYRHLFPNRQKEAIAKAFD